MTNYYINNPDTKFSDVLNKISVNNSKQDSDSVNYIIPKKNSDEIDFDFNYFNTTIDNLNYDLTINLELFRKNYSVNNKYKYKIYTIQTKYEFGGVVTLSLTKGKVPYTEHKLLSNNNSINFIIIDDDDINHLYSSFNLLNINSDYYYTIPKNNIYTIPDINNNNSLYINLDYKYIYINNSISSLDLVLNSPNNTNFNNKDNTVYTFQLLYPYGFSVKITTRPLVGTFILDSSSSTIKLSYINNLWTILENKKNSSYITANKEDEKNNTIPLIFRTIKEQNYKSVGNQLSASKDVTTIAFSAVNASGFSSTIFIYKYDKKTTNWYRETLISTIINENNIIENITLNTKILLSGDGNKLFISNIQDNINNDNSVIYNVYYKGQKIIVVGKDTNNNGLIGYSNDEGKNWTQSDTGSALFNIRGEGRGVAFGNDRYVAVGKDNKNGVIGYSNDGGVTWIKSEGSGLFGVGGVVYNVFWNVDKFIAVGKTKVNGLIVYSYNGINWISSVSGSSLLGKNGIGYSINISGNVLNVTGNNSIIGSSLNGIDWFKQDTTLLYGENNKNGVGYNITSSTSIAVVVGKYLPVQSTLNKGLVGYINTGGRWTKSDSGSSSDFFGDGEAFGVAFGNNTFVAVGKNKTSGLIAYSTNGNTWSESESGSNLVGKDGVVYNITWDNNKFIAVGKRKGTTEPFEYNGFVISSIDGNNWSKIQTPLLFTPISPTTDIKGKVCVYNRTIENNIVKWVNNPSIISPLDCTKNFGISLALSCDDLIIGDTGNNSVYCYKFDGTNWVFPQKITGYDSVMYTNFGNSISISPNGEMFVVGGPGGVSNNIKGCIWIYIKNNEGIFESYLDGNVFTLREEYKNQKEFGYKVLISPDFKNIIVSSKYKEETGDYNVFIYEIKNKSCYLVYNTKADEDYAVDFGKSMVITGDSNVLIIGSPSLSSPNKSYIYIYKKENGLWVYLTKYINSNILYGSSLSLQDNGNLLLVAIPTNDFNSSIVIHT